MRNYNYFIEDEKEWEDFKKNYKEKLQEKNLNDAISKLIKQHNERVSD